MRTHRMKSRPSFAIPATLLASVLLASHSSQAQKACSLTGLNGSCTLTVDRLNPRPPSIVYVRYRSIVTVVVKNGLPFETLTMDLKKSTEKPAVDEYQNGFTALTTALGGMQVFSATIIGTQPPANDQERLARDQATKNRQQTLKQTCPDSPGPWSDAQIATCQKEISAEFAGADGKSSYKQILRHGPQRRCA